MLSELYNLCHPKFWSHSFNVVVTMVDMHIGGFEVPMENSLFVYVCHAHYNSSNDVYGYF
jgi:hypothetical protein